MTNINTKAATVLGLSLIIGLSALGFLVQQMAVKFKEYERVVAVKGCLNVKWWPIPSSGLFSLPLRIINSLLCLPLSISKLSLLPNS